MAEKQLSEQESLRLITEMIQKAKAGVHENGVGALLWGTTVGIAGFLGFCKYQFNIDYAWFDPWMLCAIALIPQAYLVHQERKQQRKAKSHQQDLLNAVWSIYGLSIFLMIFYFNIIPSATAAILKANGEEIVRRNIATGAIVSTSPNVFSSLSLLMILYAIPTLITGIGMKIKSMVVGGIINIILFFISLYVTTQYDNLLAGFVGIFNWFIPGLILRKKYLKAQQQQLHV
jgi:hypothetical protein